MNELVKEDLMLELIGETSKIEERQQELSRSDDEFFNKNWQEWLLNNVKQLNNMAYVLRVQAFSMEKCWLKLFYFKIRNEKRLDELIEDCKRRKSEFGLTKFCLPKEIIDIYLKLIKKARGFYAFKNESFNISKKLNEIERLIKDISA